MEFQRFSQTNKEALTILKPDLGLKTWNDYSKIQRNNIWRYLETFFFDPEPQSEYDSHAAQYVQVYPFYGQGSERVYIQERILYAVRTLN
jgi:hypothetical protein